MKELDKTVQRKYSFSKYDPEWVARFQDIRSELVKIFGDKALHIEHVGSTSIPGMRAKPLIDVLIIVNDTRDLSEETTKMVTTGYEWGENYIAPNTLIFFRLGPDGEKLENIHVCEQGAPKVRQFLVMRDFFRAFPDKAQAYSDLKQVNALKYPNDYLAYRAAKKDFLEEIEKEAYKWHDTVKNFAEEYAKRVTVPNHTAAEQLIVCPVGIVGSGKTTVMKELSAQLTLARICTDDIRILLRNNGQGYEKTTEIATEVGKRFLDKGYSIAIDADCASEASQKLIEEVAKGSKARVKYVHITAPESIILERLKTRPSGFFKDSQEAIADYMRRKPLHEKLKINFAYTFDTSKENLREQIIDAAETISRVESSWRN